MNEGRGTTCRHCAEPISQGESGHWSHVIGPGSRLTRCDPALSGKPYGLDAEPSPPARVVTPNGGYAPNRGADDE